MNARAWSLVGVALRPLLFLLYWLSGLWPRDPRRWVFGGWSGHRYADNSAAMFEFTAGRRGDGITAAWISHDPTIVAALRARGYTAHHAWSAGGIAACARAGVFAFDGLTRDINHWLSRGAQRVLLRHGVGIKKIERAIDNPGHRLFKLFHGTMLQRWYWSYLLPWHRVRPDLVLATSPMHALQAEAYFGVAPSQTAITGMPRNDRMLGGPAAELDPGLAACIEDAHRRELPVFLYMPTFRDDAVRFMMPWSDLDRLAGEIGVRLVVKLHFVDGRRPDRVGQRSYRNLCIADPAADANALYGAADGLISDYSSAPFDFMLLDKPLIFFIPDLEEYQQFSRSLYFEFDAVTPGPKAHTLDELRSALAAASARGIGDYRDHYARTLDLFHTFRDAGSSARAYEAIFRRCVLHGRAARAPASTTVTEY
jgi:CDP-glycerol glycerophosphotransferase (TagB/SpsB family)